MGIGKQKFMETKKILEQKIDQILENYKISSKRNASNFLRNNEILINSKKITDRTEKCNSDFADISVNNQILPKTKNLYIILNKPLGSVCSTKSDSHKTVFDFISEKDRFSENCAPLHSAGRLDSQTEGLLILTTNGAFSHFLTAPETHLKKTYRIIIEEKTTKSEQEHFSSLTKNGILLPPEKKAPEYFTKSAELNWLSPSELEMTLTEGKFHQVRRMISCIGLTLKSLKRISIGSLKIPENLKPGEYCFFNPEELFFQ